MAKVTDHRFVPPAQGAEGQARLPEARLARVVLRDLPRHTPLPARTEQPVSDGLTLAQRDAHDRHERRAKLLHAARKRCRLAGEPAYRALLSRLGLEFLADMTDVQLLAVSVGAM